MRSRYHARGIVTATPATRASRAAVWASDSPTCPRKGLTATLEASGQTGGIALTAASTASVSPAKSSSAAVTTLIECRSINQLDRSAQQPPTEQAVEDCVRIQAVGQMHAER